MLQQVNLVPLFDHASLFVQDNVKGDTGKAEQFFGPFLVGFVHEKVVHGVPTGCVVALENFAGAVQGIATNGDELHLGVVGRQLVELIQGRRALDAFGRPKVCRSAYKSQGVVERVRNRSPRRYKW